MFPWQKNKLYRIIYNDKYKQIFIFASHYQKIFMKKVSVGRKVDLAGINIHEVALWLDADKHAKIVIKCQAIVSLGKGNSMQDVCAVLGITRETVRKWKQLLRQNGLSGFLSEKKAGKRSRISIEQQKELRLMLKQKPRTYGYEQKKWSGLMVQNLLQTKWGISIGVRTAQIWISKLK
jgi:transposase